MSDAFKKVQPGNPLSIPASAYNAFIDAALDYRHRKSHIVQDELRVYHAETILVRNDSGSDRDRFNVLGISEPIILPTDNSIEFLNRIAFKGVIPSYAISHDGRFVILAEPIANGKIGRAFVSGVCPVKLYVENNDHTWRYADIGHNDATCLRARVRGSATILWREGGIGLQWAVVRLDKRATINHFPVNLTKTGGSQGSRTSAATWTYNVYDIETDQLLASNVNPVETPHHWQRPTIGPIRPATYGIAYYQFDSGGNETLVLDWINEVPEQIVSVFPVSLSVAGGYQGGDTWPATWTYNVYDIETNELLASDVSPHHWQRPLVGQMRQATFGFAYYLGNQLKLGWVNEVAEQESCGMT